MQRFKDAMTAAKMQTYMRLCSLQSGCCRDLHKASTPLSPTLLLVRSTFLSTDWPEHKAADSASIDAEVSWQSLSLLISKQILHSNLQSHDWDMY